MSFWKYVAHKIKQIFGFKDKVVYQLEKIFIKEMDIIRLLTRLHELEKLKLILFDEDQLVLFNSLSRPLINISEELLEDSKISPNMKMSQLIEGYKKKKDLISTRKSFQKIKNKSKDHDTIDKRLMNLVDDKFKNR